MIHINPFSKFSMDFLKLPVNKASVKSETQKVVNSSTGMSHNLLQKCAFVIILLTFLSSLSFAATKTWALSGAGAWNVGANWSGGTVPLAGDDVIINLTAAGIISNVPTISLNSVSIGGTANVTFTSAAGSTITINNIDATVALNIIAGRSLTLGAGTAATAVNLTFQSVTTATSISGTLINTAANTVIVSPSQTLTIAGTGTFTAIVGTITVNGTISNAGTVTGAAALTFGASSTYIHNRDGGTIPTATWNATSNCNITGLTATAPGGLVQNFGNFNYNSTYALPLGGNLTVTGNLDISNGSITATTFTINLTRNLTGTNALSFTTGTLNIGGNFTNSGTFTCGTSTLNYNGVAQQVKSTTYNNLTISGSGIKTLQGDITIGGTATFNTAGCALGINGNTLSLNKSTAGVIGTITGGPASNIVITGNATPVMNLPNITGGLNNFTINKTGANNTVTLGGDLNVAGTLTLTAGTLSIAANSLTLPDGANLSYGAGSLTGGVTSNLTIGTGADVTLNAIAGGLNNLSTSRNIILGAGLSLNGTLTLTAGTFAVAGNTLTLNGPTIAGTPANLITTAASSLVFGGTTAGVLIPSSVALLSGLSITNTSIVGLQSSPTISGIFNPTGAGLSIGANTLTLNGVINCGTLVGGPTSNIIIGGGGAAILPGVTLNNLTINRAVTMCGSVTVGGTLTLTLGALSIAANTLTLSNAGTLSYGGGSLTGGVTSNLAIGTGADITLNAIAGGLNNLSSSRNIILGAGLSLNGTLTLTAGTFAVAGNTLTLNGPTIAGTPANLITTAASSLVFGGTTAGVLIPSSVALLNGLSITNTSIVALESSPTISGTFIPTGAGLSIGANTLTLNGQINCGTLVGGATSNIIIGGPGPANLSGVTLNNLTLNRAVTMCGNVTMGGILTLTSGALSIAANTLTLPDAANLSYGAGSLTGGVTSNLTIGTGADITLNAIAGGLNNLSSSRNIILGAGLSLNGTLT